MSRNQNAETVQQPKPPTLGRSTLQDQQFEERLKIAERLVQALREAGRSCELVLDGRLPGEAPKLKS
jgi:hypothetical protein